MESGHMKIAVHVFAGISLFHTTAPVTVFGEVTRLGLADGWEVVLWSDTGGTIRTAEGISLAPIADPSAARDADLLILPSWHEDLRPPLWRSRTSSARRTAAAPRSWGCA